MKEHVFVLFQTELVMKVILWQAEALSSNAGLMKLPVILVEFNGITEVKKFG
jgi:hypothetical protein